jgi:predicted RNA polymerase sigma factor
MALMCFHSSRSDGRVSDEGEIILLPQQDRSKWNRELITAGQSYLIKAGRGDRISIYHFVAMIALEHCTAVDYSSTNWTAILSYYDSMLSYAYDPVTYLNKCIIILETVGPQEAL